MKRVLLLLGSLTLAIGLLLPQPVLADDDDYETDALYAEGDPPVVPHKMEANASGEACLVCHLEGKNGAPPSPHAVRIDCVQCHVQGEITAKIEKVRGKKASHKKKKQHKEDE